MKCPHCKKEFNAGTVLGAMKSEKKAASSKLNGKRGGRPAKAPTMPHAASQTPTQPKPTSNACAVCGKPAVRFGWLNGVVVDVCQLHG